MTFDAVAGVTRATVVCRGTSLKRSTLIACLCVVLQLVSPPPAHAWFGWLDHLSGPGPFWTQQYEFRVACFGSEFNQVQRLEVLLATANRIALEAYRDSKRFDAAQAAWGDFEKELRKINTPRSQLPSEDRAKAFPVIPSADVEAFSKAIGELKVEHYGQLQPAYPVSLSKLTVPDVLKSPVNAVAAQAAELTARIFRANISVNSIGMLWSLCTPTKTRRWALELGATLGQANSDPNFAGDHTIRLVTLMPSVSYRLFADPRFDAIDVGAGVGGYWFSSRGFDELRGIVLQPIRVDLHAPTRWVNSSSELERLLAFFTLRFGFIVFPAGFEPNAFAATGDKARAIGAEWVPTATIFVNLQPLLKRWKPQ